MALYHEDVADIELNNGNISRSWAKRTIGSGDANANRFGIKVYRDGTPVDLTGCTCQAIFMNAAGQNIALTSYGSVNANIAYVTLPQACYNVEGQFSLAIKLLGAGVTGTMRIVDGVVDNTGTNGAIAPTESIPTYQEIIDVYYQVVEDEGTITSLKNAVKQYPAITTLNENWNGLLQYVRYFEIYGDESFFTSGTAKMWLCGYYNDENRFYVGLFDETRSLTFSKTYTSKPTSGIETLVMDLIYNSVTVATCVMVVDWSAYTDSLYIQTSIADANPVRTVSYTL